MSAPYARQLAEEFFKTLQPLPKSAMAYLRKSYMERYVSVLESALDKLAEKQAAMDAERVFAELLSQLSNEG